MHTDLLASATTAASSLNSLSGGAFPGSFPGAASGTGGAPFSGLLQDAVANLRALEDRASSAVEGLVAGRGVDVHAAMIATEKSDLAFEMALAVRGKLVSAYQTMMGVQF
jgi:flagellar hook-basal body complex protein FliE